MKEGLLISFDGLDSSGKATQTRCLTEHFEAIGRRVHQLQTPDYETESGKELKLRLQNKLGVWEDTPWREKMHLFAENRKENKEKVKEVLRKGDIVIYDRYVPSSLVFMAVEAGDEASRSEVHRAVKEHEYEINGMPQEHASIFLDVPPRTADTLLQERKIKRNDEDEYTDHISVQQRMYEEYVWLSNENSKQYIRIECMTGDTLHSIEDISERVWQELSRRFFLA